LMSLEKNPMGRSFGYDGNELKLPPWSGAQASKCAQWRFVPREVHAL
jgi:hypothetical protein